MTLYSDALRVAFFANHHPDAEPSSVEMAKLEKSIRAYLSAAALASREPSPVASEGVKESLRAIAVEFETDGREGRAANVDAIAAHITALEAEVARKDDALDNAGKLILDKIAEVAKLTKERDEFRGLFHECGVARDTAGFIGSVPECIEALDADADALRSALAKSEAARRDPGLTAEVERLREALEPFAAIADTEDEVGRYNPDDDRIWIVQAYGCKIGDLTIEDLHRARAALGEA